ncbi:MAG: carboxymuconolactone decarboxylase family protein [Phycisphaerae bacterium]|nr:carboxymuconolactone decarboxylase family protein [Phycisphaerae bacterium]
MSESNGAFFPAWSESMARMKSQTPDIARSFGGMFQGLMKEGALTTREKELIALAIGLSQRCEPCIWSHMEKCVKAGATREQVFETAGVAVMMGGGPTYTYVPKVIEAFEYFAALHR